MWTTAVLPKSVGLLAVMVVFGVAAVSVAAGVSGEPRLHPVAADIRRARSLLVPKTDLPAGFHVFRPNRDLPPRFTGTCDKLAAPDLSALTETASVSAPVLANTDSAAEYLPTAYVFVSPAQSSRAQTLETGPEDAACGVAIIKHRLELIPTSKITGETQHLIARKISGVVVRAREVIITVTVQPNYSFRFEASFIFLRYRRALSELRTLSPWSAATRRTWDDVVTAAARRLRHSGF